MANDNVNHPQHYTSHPSGVECITITRHYCFAIGNALSIQDIEDMLKEDEP